MPGLGSLQSTFTWSRIFEMARVTGDKKGQFGNSDVDIVQMVSAAMYRFFPWRFTLTNTPAIAPPGTLPLVDQQQDYAAPTDLYRLVSAAIWRTDITPNQVLDKDVVKTLTVDLNPTSYNNIEAISYEPDLKIIRLDSAISAPAPSTFELRLKYQPFLDPVLSLDQQPWFPDEYVQIAHDGILYKLWGLDEDPRAGSVSTSADGQRSFSGQYAAFIAGLQAMAGEEDAGAIDTMFPADPIGIWNANQGYNPVWGAF
jgi:hypothetical protein